MGLVNSHIALRDGLLAEENVVLKLQKLKLWKQRHILDKILRRNSSKIGDNSSHTFGFEMKLELGSEDGNLTRFGVSECC